MTTDLTTGLKTLVIIRRDVGETGANTDSDRRSNSHLNSTTSSSVPERSGLADSDQSHKNSNTCLRASIDCTPNALVTDSIRRRRLGPEFCLDDFIGLTELGRGNGGIVSKIQHKPTGLLAVRKTFDLDIKTTTRAQIVRDLQILCDFSSPFVIDFYGAYHLDSTVNICMEYMDAGGLDALLPIVGRFPEPIIIQIADSIVQGLLYLWQERHIIHRYRIRVGICYLPSWDPESYVYSWLHSGQYGWEFVRNIKPSNVLVSRSGSIKLCDLVVSYQLSEHVASAFIGMHTYMAPERLTGDLFNSTSDVWSLGLTLMELAIGHYPIPTIDLVDFVRAFAPDQESNMIEHWKAVTTGELLPALTGTNTCVTGVFELFAYVVEQPAPRLPAYCFSTDFIRFVHACLQKDPVDRLSIELLHTQILPNLMQSQAPHQPFTKVATVADVSFADYLRAVFARQQAEALDAVALAVGEDFDAIDTEIEPPLSDSWINSGDTGAIPVSES